MHATERTIVPLHVPLHATTLGLTIIVCTCSIIYGLMTHENVELMGARGDLTPLYLPLGPSWWWMPVRLLFSQFICLSPGELVLTIVCISCSGRLDRLLSLQRLWAVFFVLLIVRLATILTWCAVVTHTSILDTRVRPSALWLCASVYALRCCLCRSQSQLLLGRVLPVNAHPMHHVTTMLLTVAQVDAFADTTLPALCAAGVLCTEAIGVHRWSWADSAIDASVRWVCGGRRFTHFIKKSVSFPATTQTAARGAPRQNGGQLNPRRSLPAGSTTDVTRRRSLQNVHELVGMGFSDADSRAALAAADGDVNQAAVLLLEGRTAATS